ncbi:uncharacterized protein LOC113506950 isoform X2 [Trichoplusia ni]|uniref:Uncharacterized protein LOC113506950 isoform X2 n=1 Tax=Trichoplusia ni TaxID=7111 RepID=A0A7E5WZH7_TRINI|nr:uncharacterized protein LOC113506950 isoform X2 [Trichoplusia ni]
MVPESPDVRSTSACDDQDGVDEPMEIGGDSIEVAEACALEGGDVFKMDDEVIEIEDDSDDEAIAIVVEAEEGVDAANDGGVEEDMSEEWLDEDLWTVEPEVRPRRRQRKAKKPKEVCKDVINTWLAMRNSTSGTLESLLRIWIKIEDVFIHRLNQCKCHSKKKC